MTLRYGLGDSVSISTYIGYVGEIGINTTTQTIHVFDGSTAGGTALAKLSEVGGGGGGSSVNYWASNASGIYTTRNVAIGTNIISLGSTVLLVKGDTKITGILTIGQGIITLDPNTNTISADNLTGTATTATNLSDAANITTGTINSARLSGTYNIDINGNASSATYATIAGISTYATSSGISTYTTTAGIATYATLSGIATYASTAGVATSLQNSRTFEITGDVVASPISFNGSSNVSLVATIQPNSVALGTDTTGDYVQSVSGTSNQITVTSGTGEGSTPTLSIPSQFTAPQDVTVTRDLQVNRNLSVNGNITIGGTSATLFTTELKIYDPDLVLGFRTDALGNDTSTDNTANHGGIAIASTEGTPLIQLYDVGIGETNPATYKKFMWFKSGTFAGLGTDAWLSNYAIGIGSTQFPVGTRLAAGSVQFTERDLAVVRNINASGVITATSFSGNASSATYSTTSGIATYASTAGIATYASTAGIATTSTNATTAFGLSGTPNITVGNITGAAATFTNLTVNGTQTIINTQTLEIADKTVGIGSTSSPTDALADGSGITVYGTTNKTLYYDNTRKGWDFNIPLTTDEVRFYNVAEKVTIVNGNTANLVYGSNSSNVAICTNPTGNITLNVTGIPTSSDFDNSSITFTVISNATAGVAYSCLNVNLNGYATTIKWVGGSSNAAVSGATTTSGYTFYGFTAMNTVGSAATTANYVVFGSASGGFW